VTVTYKQRETKQKKKHNQVDKRALDKQQKQLENGGQVN